MCTQAAPMPGVTHCLGVYDGISLMAAERAGAEVLYVSGYGLSASLLGMPDEGLLTQTEMAQAIARLCGQTDLPVIADADTGFGGLGHVARTMTLWERAGVAGLHIEDQAFPKGCAQTGRVALVPAEQMVDRIKALADARRNRAVMLIARTDALAHEPPVQVAHRCALYAQAGADALFINAPGTRERFAAVAEPVQRLMRPLVFNAVRSPRTPAFTDTELAALGVRFVLHPVDALVAASQAMSHELPALVRGGSQPGSDAFIALSGALEQRHRERGHSAQEKETP